MKLFGNRKGAEHIAARKTEKKTGGLKRWQRVTIIVAAIVLVLGGTALAVYKVNVKPPVKQPEPVETEPLPEEETVKKPTVYVPATEVDEETGEETEIETEVPASHRAGVYNILIAGTDGDGYRTDTIIVAHLDENTHEVALMSVPRDTAVMNGNGGLMKINSVYANGKEEGMERLTKEPLQIVDGWVEIPKKPGLGIDVDMEQVKKAHQLYLDNCLGGRDDAAGMQYLIPGWKFDPKRPCMVR